MRIGIHISTLLNHGMDIGAGRYIYNLVKNLLAVDSTTSLQPVTYVLTARYITDEHMAVIDEFKKLKANNHNLDLKLFKTSRKNLDYWNRLRFPPIELLGFKADLLHCPDFLIPPTLNKNIILTIHDLAFIRFPQFNFDWFIKKYTKEVAKNAHAAKRISADSQSTKNDLINFFGINTEKIDVIYLGAEEKFRRIDKNPGKIDLPAEYNLRKKYNIEKKFILSVGTIEPRKNYENLIRAFNILKKDGLDIQLVIAGRTGWKSEPTFEEKEKSPFRKDIIFTGRLTDDELVWLYNMAELFVYPSIFEGFGLPVLEAMQCGLPIVASNTSSIPEIINDPLAGAFLVEVNNDREFSEKIKLILSDRNLREELSEKSVANAVNFSWSLTAKKTFTTYLKVIENI